MKILILGNGAREHALAWACANSKRNSGLFCLPGNAGTIDIALNIPGNVSNIPFVVSMAKRSEAKIVVVGPETPLAMGVVDALKEQGIMAFGPDKRAAQLEASKVFGRELAHHAGVPTAESHHCKTVHEVMALVNKNPEKKLVVKKSGLAAGKGVLESDNPAEIQAFAEHVINTENDHIVVEEFLCGYELSVFAILDGENYLVLPVCADHKKAQEDNKGPNTGGMGAVCPIPSADSKLLGIIEDTIIQPTISQMKKEHLMYSGVLFFGIMVTDTGPKLLEYNVRFGDPETQSLLPLLNCDIADLLEAAVTHSIKGFHCEFVDKTAVGITIAAPGYPGDYKKNIPVTTLPKMSKKALLFHAGTTVDRDGRLFTGGGRCFTAVGLGYDYFEAHAHALDLASKVDFAGAWYRRDIGKFFFE